MTKFFYPIFFIFFSLQVFSQDVKTLNSNARFASDKELMTYVEKAKENGLSLINVEELIKTQGATDDEVLKLRNLWNGGLLKKPVEDIRPTTTTLSLFGDTFENEVFPESSRRFGSAFFENKNINEVPQLFIATPLDYRLGPGDELIINLFGASDNSYSVQISRNGTVKLDRMAPVYLSGLSINSAKNRLKNRLSKLYVGLFSDDNLNKVDIDVSLQKARSVVVNIAGQVTAPGTYTISGFSSVLNALYAAGGPNEVGSFRNIKLIRNGKVAKTIDLYDYFVDGTYPNIYLRDQDVILVESHKKQVNVESGFKTNALYELKENETILDLLKISGGLSSNSFKNSIYINRIKDFSRIILEISKEEFSKSSLNDGDIIEAREVSDIVSNSVSIEGAVFLPGIYDLSKASSVGKLIDSSSGLTTDANNSALLYRTNNGIEDEIVSINLNNQNDLNTILIDQDRLVIISNDEIKNERTIRTEGEVSNPGSFEYNKGMTLRDAIILSGGFTEFSDKAKVSVIRNQSFLNENDLIKQYTVDFSTNDFENNIELYPDDIISVKKIPFYEPTKSFFVRGEVEVQGSFAVTKKNYGIKDAFLENIDVLRSASSHGVFLERGSIKIPIKGKIQSKKFITEMDLEIVSGDVIFVSKSNKTINIYGDVHQESIIVYQKNVNFKNAITNAGGYLETADKKRAYVEYQNGRKKSVNSFLGLKFYPKLKPGSTIFVPSKTELRGRTSVAEIVGYTTSLVSIIALIKSF